RLMFKRKIGIVALIHTALVMCAPAFAGQDHNYPCPQASFIQYVGSLMDEAQNVGGIWLVDYTKAVVPPNDSLAWYVGAHVHAKNQEDAFRVAKIKASQVTHPKYPYGETSEGSGFAFCYYGKDVFAYTSLVG